LRTSRADARLPAVDRSGVLETGRLGLREARESPCMTCESSPCCTHLPLHTFQVRSLRDLDHAMYLLNFERIVLGLSPNGDWSVYYKYPCRFLDRTDPKNAVCTIHGQPLQPQICVNYSPFTCWYKRALTPSVGGEFLTIDRRRMELVVERLVFDEQRNIVETPDWDTMIAMLANVPLEPGFDHAPEGDPVFDAWLANAAVGEVAAAPPAKRGYLDLLDSCSGCAAHCCKTLVFPHGRPSSRKALDYLQFVLGFPGIELGVTDGEWHIIVRTRCRHLTADNRCGVYGQPERPSICRYYDASSCSYVVQFGHARPAGFMRVRLEQFFWMTEAMSFDESGMLVELPRTEQIRELVEARWRDAVHEAADVPVATEPERIRLPIYSPTPTADVIDGEA
jgi:Fe-S-cluster containining protein